MNMLHTTGNLAPNRKPMPFLKRAVRNRNVGARSIRPRRINRARLDRDIVISHARPHMVNHNMARTEGINRVRIRRLRRQNRYIPKDQIIRVIRHHLPETRIPHRNIFHPNMLRVVKHHAHRPRMVHAQHAHILQTLHIIPPDMPVAINRPTTGNHDILRIH